MLKRIFYAFEGDPVVMTITCKRVLSRSVSFFSPVHTAIDWFSFSLPRALYNSTRSLPTTRIGSLLIVHFLRLMRQRSRSKMHEKISHGAAVTIIYGNLESATSSAGPRERARDGLSSLA